MLDVREGPKGNPTPVRAHALLELRGAGDEVEVRLVLVRVVHLRVRRIRLEPFTVREKLSPVIACFRSDLPS
jgi:hypothetical protein